MRILLVEDERPLAKEINDFLQSEHHVVDVVSSKKMASENLAVNSYDFALVDLGLPDGDGLDLLQDVSRYQKDASVIILTARTEVGDKILYSNRAGQVFKVDGAEVFLLKEENIIGVFE